MKQCKTCKEKKPISDYSRHPQNVDGYFTECKDCVKQRTIKRKAEIEKRKEFEII